MSDTDTLMWIDAAGQAHSALNVPEFEAPQQLVVRQIRRYFELDAHFWQGQSLAEEDLDAMDRLLRVILPTVPPSELTRKTARETVHFLIRWFAL